uniref:hypothetical protein n=1 Tax=Candidatus Enterovibrio escicola TaxID=1927127 RepID=UPI0016800DC7
ILDYSEPPVKDISLVLETLNSNKRDLAILKAHIQELKTGEPNALGSLTLSDDNDQVAKVLIELINNSKPELIDILQQLSAQTPD